MPERIELLARFVPSPGSAYILERELRQVVAASREEPGCLDIRLWAGQDDRFYTRSTWRDQAALEEHRELAHTVAFQAALPPLLAEPLVIDRIAEVDLS